MKTTLLLLLLEEWHVVPIKGGYYGVVAAGGVGLARGRFFVLVVCNFLEFSCLFVCVT